MAKVGAQRAAELTGKSKSTIQRAMNSGKLSYEMDNNKRRIIDVSELERVYGLAGTTTASSSATSPVNAQAAIEAELKKASDMIEMERMKMKIKALEDKLEVTHTSMEDLRAQRDQWQKQAQQVLITSQYSQKQAEEYKTELKTREESARKRREHREKTINDRMNNLQGQNENGKAGTARPSNNSGQNSGPSSGTSSSNGSRVLTQQERQQRQAAQRAAQNNQATRQQATSRPGGQDRGRKLTEENASKGKDLKELLDFQGLWKKIKGDKAA